MKIFLTGASGYIGGSVAQPLLAAGHEIVGLARNQDRARQLRALGMQVLVATLDDADPLAEAARAADVIINTADAEHAGCVDAMLDAIAGSDKTFIHTSGTSIVADLADGAFAGKVFDETTPFDVLPLRAGRVAINARVLSAAQTGLRSMVICPSLIYGTGRGLSPDSIQVPWLVEQAREHRIGRHVGEGLNVWSNVHIDDLVSLYVLALEKGQAGAFYFAENGENSMREAACAISDALGFGAGSRAMSVDEAIAAWGEGGARYTMGSNSRVRAMRARDELGWNPTAHSMLDEISMTRAG
jgi:nucleoside-diphosphate-sugar epimerase